MRQTVKFRAPQNGIHHPPAGPWRKILLHRYDNSCYIIAIVTGWTSLVFNHMHSGQHANEEEPPPWPGAQLCPTGGPTPTHLCSLIQPPSTFPSPTLLAELLPTTGSPKPSPSHQQSANFVHFTVASPHPRPKWFIRLRLNVSRKFSSSHWVIENLFY